MNVPIYKAIKEYYESDPVPFHMPGHKFGNGLPDEFLKNIVRLDLTEIPGTDNLHYPEAAIKEAQCLTAEVFGAEHSFFLVNGSTCGVHAMIMAICKPGDKLIVSRDCHKSVINGMILAGTEPVYIIPEFDNHFGISTVLSPSEIEKGLRDNPDAAGVIITRPNYYGVCSDIKSIADIVHSYGKILLVDEAHGAHLKFDARLPLSAMEAGADMCVQSAHKTLMAFTQGAYLHVKSSRVDIEKLKFFLRLLQTSSPSYIIMASLDITRALMQLHGKELTGELVDRVNGFISRVSGSDLPFDVLRQEKNGYNRMDVTRLVLNVEKTGKTGFEADKILRKDYNIQVEMSDLYNLVCIATAADKAEYYDRLYDALHSIGQRSVNIRSSTDKFIKGMIIPPKGMELCKVIHENFSKVKLKDAVGRISSAIITPYPPGIPIVCPGEILLQDTVEYIYNIINSGGIINGIGENCEVNVL